MRIIIINNSFYYWLLPDRQKSYRIITMKCAFIDDDSHYLEIFKDILWQYDDTIELDLFNNAADFFNHLSKSRYDVIFLDIEMPETDGITIAEQLHNDNDNALIVFVTNRSETVFRAFGLNVIGFIVKDTISSQLPAVMNKVMNELSQRSDVLLSLKNGTSIKILQSSVLYCEIILRKIYLYTTDQKEYNLNYKTIQDVYSLFDHNTCMFVNRSVFVNIKKVVECTPKYVTLQGTNTPIDISRDRSKYVKEAYLKSTRL